VRPTIVFTVAFAAAWGVHSLAPLHMIATGSPNLAIMGVVLAVLGLLLFVWSLLLFGRAKTGIMYHQPAVCLMMRGPYAWSRNPQYIAFAAMYVGFAMMMNTWWPLALLPLALWAVVFGVIAAEEHYLRGKFGAAYDEYCRRVPRWL